MLHRPDKGGLTATGAHSSRVSACLTPGSAGSDAGAATRRICHLRIPYRLLSRAPSTKASYRSRRRNACRKVGCMTEGAYGCLDAVRDVVAHPRRTLWRHALEPMCSNCRKKENRFKREKKGFCFFVFFFFSLLRQRIVSSDPTPAFSSIIQQSSTLGVRIMDVCLRPPSSQWGRPVRTQGVRLLGSSRRTGPRHHQGGAGRRLRAGF